MADRNRNQSNQNTSRGRQDRANDQGQRPGRDDGSIDLGGTRSRSNREPASTADDRGMGTDLDDEPRIESDVEEVDDVDDLDEGSNR
jgi:hypothetical protein